MSETSFVNDVASPADAGERVIDDGYFEGAGAGQPFSAFLLSHLARFAHHTYVKLTNKSPDEERVRVYRAEAPFGHRHGGAVEGDDDGVFVASQLFAYGVRPLRDGRLIQGRSIIRRSPLFYVPVLTQDATDVDRFVVSGEKPATFMGVMPGPGANRARVFFLWMLTDLVGDAPTAGLSVSVVLTLTNLTTGHTVTREVLSGPDGWVWTELTAETLLVMNPLVENNVTLTAKVAEAGDAYAYALSGLGVTFCEEQG